jgi:hypothetical protein
MRVCNIARIRTESIGGLPTERTPESTGESEGSKRESKRTSGDERGKGKDARRTVSDRKRTRVERVV